MLGLILLLYSSPSVKCRMKKQIQVINGRKRPRPSPLPTQCNLSLNQYTRNLSTLMVSRADGRTAAAPKGHRAFLCPRCFPSPSTGSISIPVPGCTKSSTFKARWHGSGPVWEDEWDGSSGVPRNAMVFGRSVQPNSARP